MRSTNNMVVTCFKSGAKVNISVVVSLSKCFFLSVCLLVYGRLKMAYNDLHIGDVADLVAVFFILPQMFIRSRMFLLPLNPPYSQMCCYGLVLIFASFSYC
jgi:hypothetical protein